MQKYTQHMIRIESQARVWRATEKCYSRRVHFMCAMHKRCLRWKLHVCHCTKGVSGKNASEEVWRRWENRGIGSQLVLWLGIGNIRGTAPLAQRCYLNPFLSRTCVTGLQTEGRGWYKGRHVRVKVCALLLPAGRNLRHLECWLWIFIWFTSLLG